MLRRRKRFTSATATEQCFAVVRLPIIMIKERILENFNPDLKKPYIKHVFVL